MLPEHPSTVKFSYFVTLLRFITEQTTTHIQYIPIKIIETLPIKKPMVEFIGIQMQNQQIKDKIIDIIGCFFFIKKTILITPHATPTQNCNASVIKIINTASSTKMPPFC